MPGPQNSTEALPWIQEAVAKNRYILDQHFIDQADARSFSVHDAKKIIATATACIPYPDGPNLAGGTGWRVVGIALDGSSAKVGVEAYKDHLGQWAILITIMDGE
jgi:hypothetical protein